MVRTLAAAFQNAHHRSLILRASSSDPALALRDVHVPRLAADEGFISFHFARQQVESTVFQRIAEPMRYEPSSLLCHAKIACQFATTDSVLAVHNKPQCRKPLVQSERRIFKDGSCFQRECRLLVTCVALPHSRLGQVRDLLSATARTVHFPVRPAKLYHQGATVLVIREVNDGLLECIYAFHEPNISLFSRYVKYIITLIAVSSFDHNFRAHVYSNCCGVGALNLAKLPSWRVILGARGG